MATSNNSQFGEKMSVEEFLKSQGAKSLEVFPRADKPGYFYFATEKGLGYVPQELGKKLENGEKTGRLFITAVQTEGHEEPMFMLCETKRESLLTVTVD